MTVYLVKSTTEDPYTGEQIPCIAAIADDQLPVRLRIGDSLDTTWELEDMAIRIIVFKKGHEPKTTWSAWTERIQRWIALNPRREAADGKS